MDQEPESAHTNLGRRYTCAECAAQFIVVRPGNLPQCHSAGLRPL